VEPITILVSGVEGSGGVQIISTHFSAIDNSLLFDIHLDLGICLWVTPWSYSEVIGTLSAGTYNLTVRRFLPDYYPPPIVNSYEMSFTVVPEPVTIALLAVGLPIIRVFTRRKF